MGELHETLRVNPDNRIADYRAKWIQTAVDGFTMALADPQLRFRSTAGGDGLHQVGHAGQDYLLRTDQAACVRFWGIGIEPDAPKQAVTVAAHTYSDALFRMADQISFIGVIRQGMARKVSFPTRSGGRTAVWVAPSSN